jgi:hypothetical protein
MPLNPLWDNILDAQTFVFDVIYLFSSVAPNFSGESALSAFCRNLQKANKFSQQKLLQKGRGETARKWGGGDRKGV